MEGLDIKQIGIFFLVWLVGYGLGLLEAWFKNRNKKEEKLPPLPPPAPVEEGYALALFEEEKGAEIKLDGKRISAPQALSPAERSRLLALVMGLRPWLEGPKAPAPKKAAPAPTPRSAPAQPQPAASPPPPPISTQPAASAPPPGIPASDPSPTDPEYASMSMARQIESILQGLLEGHPLKPKGIHLQEKITGGVTFSVGLQQFDFIDEIPDEDVKAIFQQAIKEWERRSTPT